MSVRKRTTDKSVQKEANLSEIISKALKAESEWQDKDEFLDVVYWIRQLLGVVLGVIWGVLAVKGIIGILMFFAINAAVVYVYFSSFQKLDEEEYGGIGEILKEGLMTSFATFMVAWIILYSSIHFD